MDTKKTKAIQEEQDTRASINRGAQTIATWLATPGKLSAQEVIDIYSLLQDWRRLDEIERGKREAGKLGGRPRHAKPNRHALAQRRLRLRKAIEEVVYAIREAAVEAADNAVNNDAWGEIYDTEVVETADGWRVKIIWAES